MLGIVTTPCGQVLVSKISIVWGSSAFGVGWVVKFVVVLKRVSSGKYRG
jgi:hypothetical protein